MKIRRFDIEEKQKAFLLLEQRNSGDVLDIEKTVSDILFDVRKNGDQALFKYTKKFDGFDVDKNNIMVTKKEIEKAYTMVDAELIEIIKRCAKNIKDFHLKQKRETWMDVNGGVKLGQLFNPIEKCGVYVPGGKAVYPSSVLMNVIPAKVAGVEKIVMATPPNQQGEISPLILAAADIAGADEIYKMGGAQAVAAMAYGTASVPSVYKITGPGNIYVATAKKQVFGKVGIDMIAGPSEVLVIDDGSVDIRFVAADMLSQAEHDELSSCMAVVQSDDRANALEAEVLRQLDLLPKKEIAGKSLENYGMIMVAKTLEQAIAFSNEVAPEHLELCVENPEALLKDIKNAGAVFMGAYSPEPLGDYFAGPNHVLPTNGTAKFSSPLNVDDFVKKSSIIGYDKKSLKNVYKDIERFAEYEGLKGHALSVKIRFE
jgi:histidinol dehydrogenase